MPLYHLDEYKTGKGTLDHHPELRTQIERRLKCNKPVMVEGLLLGWVLRSFGQKPDWLIRLVHPEFPGPEEFRSKCMAYESEVTPDIVANAVYLQPEEPDWNTPGSVPSSTEVGIRTPP